jgi:hypothetical protein
LRQPGKRRFKFFGGQIDPTRQQTVFGFQPGLVRAQFPILAAERRVHANELFELCFEAGEFGVHGRVLDKNRKIGAGRNGADALPPRADAVADITRTGNSKALKVQDCRLQGNSDLPGTSHVAHPQRCA